MALAVFGHICTALLPILTMAALCALVCVCVCVCVWPPSVVSSSTHSFTGAGNQVDLDDLLSPLKKMKSFRSLQKRLVSPSLVPTVCLIGMKYTHIHMYVCSMSEGVSVNVCTSRYRHTGASAS